MTVSARAVPACRPKLAARVGWLVAVAALAFGCTTGDGAGAEAASVYISAAGDTLRFPLAAARGAAAPAVRAVLTAQVGETGLYMDIAGAEPRARLQVLLNHGPCTDANQPVADIGPVVANAGGTATLRTALPLSMPTLVDGGHTLQLHDLGDGKRDFPPLACGSVPSP